MKSEGNDAAPAAARDQREGLEKGSGESQRAEPSEGRPDSQGAIGSVAGTDRHGFLRTSRLHDEALELGHDAFVARYPVPALVPLPRGMSPEALAAAEQDEAPDRVQLLTMAVPTPGFLLYLGKVAFLAKRPGNPFPHLVSIGRSPTNDITIAVESVSKVHGYFVPTGKGWAFTDRGSTNGSTVDDRPVAKGERCPIGEGTILRLGLEAMFEVHSPEALYRRVQKGY